MISSNYTPIPHFSTRRFSNPWKMKWSTHSPSTLCCCTNNPMTSRYTSKLCPPTSLLFQRTTSHQAMFSSGTRSRCSTKRAVQWHLLFRQKRATVSCSNVQPRLRWTCFFSGDSICFFDGGSFYFLCALFMFPKGIFLNLKLNTKDDSIFAEISRPKY